MILCLNGFAFAQSTLVVIDRDNVSSGSTSTGNNSGVTSIGFTRGSGLNAGGGGNFTSNNWEGTDQTSADENNEYIEWSVTARPTFTVEITELDIRLRRNNNGPTSWQLFYSFDNFTTPGNAINTEQTTSTSATNVNINGLSINLTEGESVTFRIYAWNANSNGGWIRIARNNAWNDFGVGGAGARIIGTATSSSTNSIESDIIVTNSFDTPENIAYINFQAALDLNPGNNAIQIADFTIRDGGSASPDGDLNPTILTDISFEIDNPEILRAVALFNDGDLVGELTSVDNIITFSNINIEAEDDGENDFQIYATFQDVVTDNTQIKLSVKSTSTQSIGSSLFEFSNAGGAATSTSGDDNRIEVIVTQFEFTQQPTSVSRFETMIPSVSLNAIDANSNIDTDYNDMVEALTSGTFDPAATTMVNANAGVISFDNLAFTDIGTDFNLTVTAFDLSIFDEVSDNFDVTGPIIVIAQQDFDGNGPEWPFTNNIPFFNNGWGSDGYYGPIDITNAFPLNWPLFSNNILGENDLNDEGENGTTDFARLTLDEIETTGMTGLKLSFDWQVSGYNGNNDDIRYRTIIDGVNGPLVPLFDGSGTPTSGEGRVVIDIVDGTSTVGFYIEIRNNGNNGYSGFDNFKLSADFDGLIYRNGIWFPDGDAPSEITNTDNALINSGTYNVSAPIELNDLNIASGARVEVLPGQTVKTFGLLNNAGVLNLNSTSTEFSSIVPIRSVNSGEVNYSRFVNKVGNSSENGGNDLVSAPLLPEEGQTFDQFITLGTPANSDVLATNGTFFAFAPYNNTDQFFDNFFVTSQTTLIPGKGYRVATTNGENLTFSGDIRTTDVTGIQVTKPAGGSQWNLVGNPYPSYVNSIDFLAANGGILDPTAVAIYGYNSGTVTGTGTLNNYTIINNIINSNINVAPGSGFFLAVENTDGFSETVDFTSAMRTVIGDNDFIVSRTNNTEHLNLRLQLSSNGKSTFTDFFFHENSTKGLDPGYDAAAFNNSVGLPGLYSHLVAENTGKNMAIQVLGLDDMNEVSVPLGIRINQASQFSIDIETSNLPSDVEVFIQDIQNNSFTDIRDGQFITTAETNINGTGRFNLVFSRNSLSAPRENLNGLNIRTNNQKQIIVNGVIQETSLVKIIDIQGRIISSHKLESGNHQRTINGNELSIGIYIVEISNSNSSISEKIVLR